MASDGSARSQAGTPWWVYAIGTLGVIGLLVFVPGLVNTLGLPGALAYPFLSSVVLLAELVLLSLAALAFAVIRLRSARG